MFLKNASARAVRQLRVTRTSQFTASPTQLRTGRRTYANASDLTKKASETAKSAVEKVKGSAEKAKGAAEGAKESASHGSHQAKTSDLPWALGAAGVTLPTLYLIFANAPDTSDKGYPGDKWHGHHDEDEEEGEEGGEEEGEEGGEKEEGGEEKEEGGEGEQEEGEEKSEGGEDKEEGGDDEKKEGGKGEQTIKDGGGQGGEHGSDFPDDNRTDPSGGSEVKRGEGKNAPGEPKEDKIGKKTASGEQGKFSEETELDTGDSDAKQTHKPDAKGGAKRRTESGYANKLGDRDDKGVENHAPAGQDKKEGGIYNKQQGLSNTDTKHSIDIGNDPNKSKKADGTPDTAKSQGTIDPGRSQ